MDLFALQAGLGIESVVIGLLVSVLIIVAVYQMVEIADACEEKVFTVFDELRWLLELSINFTPPSASRTYAFDIWTQTLNVLRQETITCDNSPVTANTIVYTKVMDAKEAFLKVDDYERAVSNLARTTPRAVLSDMELDDTFDERQEINVRTRRELDKPTDERGVRVEPVEVREASPSTDVQQAMEQQTSTEYRHRTMILEAQGECRSAVEQAEGEKQSNTIHVQGEKQSQILEAQGNAISVVLRAKSAESMGERAIIDKGMETFERIG